MNIKDKYKLSEIINASGTMTSLGASRVNNRIIEAMAEIMPEFVDMKELQRAAGQVISSATGAETGCVTASAAAGISVSVAACMTGTDFSRIEKLPDVTGLKNEVIIQKGHVVNFGARIPQMVRLTGAEVVEIGTSTRCGAYQLEGAINENTAAALYVVSHHTVQSGLLALKDFVKTAHQQGIPVIVDAASEYDLKGFIQAGADIVLYSGHKFMGGPTSGIVAGKKELVRASYFQEIGIGRGMKVGKEAIVGAMVALEEWVKRDAEQIKQLEEERIDYALNFLNQLTGITAVKYQDPTGNPITRLKVMVDPEQSSLSAFALSQQLAAGKPSIKVRNHHVDLDFFFLDPCNLLEGEIEKICERIKFELENPSAEEYLTENLADLEIEYLKLWPDNI